MRLFGDLITVAKNVPEGFREIRAKKGDTARMRFGLTRALLCSNPDDVKSILTAKEPEVTKSKYSRMFRNLFGDSIISSSGDDWQRQHNYLIEHFHARNVGRWTSVIMPITETWLKRVGETEKEFGAESEARILIQDIVGELLFGDLLSPEARRETLGNLQTLNDEIFGQFITNTVMPGPLQLIPTPGRWRVAKAKRRFGRMIYKLLEGEIPEGHPSIIAKLLAVEPRISREEIRDQISILYFAGQDTTARALAWTLLLLSRHPTEVEKIRQEALTAIDGTELNRSGLEHTLCVVNESMRLFPPAHTLDRQINVPGFLPKQGQTTPILSPISVTNLHSDERLWADPDSFDPNRFLRDRSLNRHQCAFMPFGYGKRTCIGKPLAILELILITALICRQYNIVCLNPDDIKAKAAVSLGPSPDVQICLSPVGNKL